MAMALPTSEGGSRRRSSRDASVVAGEGCSSVLAARLPVFLTNRPPTNPMQMTPPERKPMPQEMERDAYTHCRCKMVDAASKMVVDPWWLMVMLQARCAGKDMRATPIGGAQGTQQLAIAHRGPWSNTLDRPPGASPGKDTRSTTPSPRATPAHRRPSTRTAAFSSPNSNKVCIFRKNHPLDAKPAPSSQRGGPVNFPAPGQTPQTPQMGRRQYHPRVKVYRTACRAGDTPKASLPGDTQAASLLPDDTPKASLLPDDTRAPAPPPDVTPGRAPPPDATPGRARPPDATPTAAPPPDDIRSAAPPPDASPTAAPDVNLKVAKMSWVGEPSRVEDSGLLGAPVLYGSGTFGAGLSSRPD
ncbi:uncharacterized protein PV07_08671 [Cladophialophora immunda]|uniref:Uncharacterized protein n=1 Tax=Cladophialophora immunda TaxID=569365 RepID=A0A0D2C504_9EURO|nr:uncharacterized protein PV07_08671 [Cladophialophora immunda]KIW25505.1 hypothetical protein PV07_08671 [Cladophialophora immunda]